MTDEEFIQRWKEDKAFRRYAKALFSLMDDQIALDAVGEIMNVLNGSGTMDEAIAAANEILIANGRKPVELGA